jgi:hypothetical protein
MVCIESGDYMISFVNGMYTAVINGKTVKRKNLKHLEYVIRSSAKAESVAAPIVQESKFTINQRFGFLSDMIVMLAKGDQPSVVVTGPGGLGKSHTVTTALRNAGLKDLSVLDEYDVGAPVPKNAFIVIKGYSTPKGLYRTLYENRNSVIVFDDCDSVLKDAVSLNLLKGALDSYSKRIISWRADIKDEDLPTSFEFKGRVVFISNMSSNQLDQAIISRSMSVDVTMTKEQKVERMRHLVSEKSFMPDFDLVCKNDALNLIGSLVDSVKELSLRTLIQVTKIRKSNPNGNWKDLATYAICG